MNPIINNKRNGTGGEKGGGVYLSSSIEYRAATLVRTPECESSCGVEWPALCTSLMFLNRCLTCQRKQTSK